MAQHFERKGYDYVVRSEPNWEPVTPHGLPSSSRTANAQQATISEAIGIFETTIRNTQAFTSPSDVKQF